MLSLAEVREKGPEGTWQPGTDLVGLHIPRSHTIAMDYESYYVTGLSSGNGNLLNPNRFLKGGRSVYLVGQVEDHL